MSQEECAAVAKALELDVVDPSYLGANLMLAGIVDLSGLTPASRLQFPSGATLFITEQNGPCRFPGRELANAFARPELEMAFPKAAQGRRGLVALVEREGFLDEGDVVTVIMPRQAKR